MARRKPSQLNCLIAVDKPVGCTSHDVVARVRRTVGERRVGHAGTLDPLASGVMVVGIGQATRLLGRITQDTKSYIADIAFGAETNTDDAEGEVVRTAPVGDAVRDTVSASELLTSMLGDQMQVPPAFSAISVDGVRSYRRARAGEEVELPARPVHVFAADLIAVSDIDGAPVWTVAFTVSKGTYIRALARDIGRASGSAAHIASLRRTASGTVTLSGCVALDALSPSLVPDDMLDPIGVLGLPAIEVPERYLGDILCGRALSADLVQTAGEPVEADGSVALTCGGQLRALARLEGHRLAMTDVFPQGIGGVRS